MYLFCDKTFVVRPTSDPKKLKFMKICQKLVENRQNTHLGAFLGVPPRKISFPQVSTHKYKPFLRQKFFVRPTRDLKKLKFMKICQKLVENRQNTPLGAFLGVRPKFFFTNCFNSSIGTFFVTKVLL